MSADRPIATAYVALRPKVSNNFEAEAERDLHPTATRLGARFGSVVGKSIGAALKPEVTAGIGSAALLLQGLADKQTEASNKLRAAIEQSGGSLDAFKTRVDAQVDANQRLGISGAKTNDELAELTLALGSPERALKKLTVAQDIAAGTGRSFAGAVELLRRAQDGEASAYEQLGIHVKDLAGAQKALAGAQKDATTAADRVGAAQDNYNDKLAIYRQTVKPTLAQQIALKDSHDRLVKAQQDSARAAGRVTAAQKEVRSATYDNERAQTELANKFKGQASSGANTFLGRLKALRVEGTDHLGHLAASAGNKAGEVGLALLGISSVTKTVAAAFRTLRNTEVSSSAAGALAIEANAAKGSAAMIAEGDVALSTAARMRAAFAGMGAVAATAFALSGAIPDQQKLPGIGGLSKKQTDAYLSLIDSRGKSAGKVGSDDLKAIDKFLAGRDDKQSTALRTLIEGILAQRAPQHSLGFQISAALQKALDSDDPKVAARARAQLAKITAQAAAAGKTQGTAAGKATGDATLQGFLDSINGGKVANAAADALAQQIEAARQKAIDAVQGLVDAARQRFEEASNKLQQDIQAKLELQRQVANTATQGSTLADAFRGTNSGVRNDIGDRPVGGAGGVKQVEAFLHQRAVKIARFAKALTQLRKKGLDQRLVAEIADLGTDEGLEIATSLLNASSADIRTINLEEQQIARAANTVGKKIADAQYGGLIEADKQNTARLESKLNELLGELKRITRNPASIKVDVKETGASPAAIGNEVARRVTQAMKGLA